MKIKFSKKAKIALIILTICFIILTILMYTNKLLFIDEWMNSTIISIRSKKLTNIMSIITNIGSAYSLIVITILLFCIIKNKKYPIIITINLIASFIIGQILKFIIRRPRPIDTLIKGIGYSYPSGHSLVSMAYFGLIIYLIGIKINNKNIKNILIIFNTILIILISFSRIYLGVHYLTDIVGGMLLAAIYLIVFINIIKKEPKK